MTHRIAVGTPVTVSQPYGTHKDRPQELVVLSDQRTGYGVGFKGNNPDKFHNGDAGWLYYSDRELTPKEESKTVTIEFNKGDKVRVIDSGSSSKEWVGVEGIVQGQGYGSAWKLELTTSPNSYYPVGAEANIPGYKLELIEAKFTFKDIQKGDTIRRTEKWDSTGTVNAVEGVVTHVTNTQASTGEGLLVGYYRDDENPHMTLELLSRPEPEPVKEAWETAKPGTVIPRGKDFLILNDKGWAVLYEDGSLHQFGLDDAKALLGSNEAKVLAPR